MVLKPIRTRREDESSAWGVDARRQTILYPMRMRDFRRFGYTDALQLGPVAEE